MGAFLDHTEHAPVGLSIPRYYRTGNRPLWRFQRATRPCAPGRDAIRGGVTVNLDHLFAGLVQEQPEGRLFTERDYRERLFLCSLQAQKRDVGFIPLSGNNAAPCSMTRNSPLPGIVTVGR